jgi:predicted MPP superfamily phosphohydrolase
MSRLLIFLSLYFCIYGSAHLYLLIKARRAFYLYGVNYFLLFAIFTFLLLAPINARLLEGQGHWLPSQILAWIGFIWMGFVFIFTCLALPMDGYHLLVGTGQQLLGVDWTSIMLSKRQSIGLITLFTCAAMGYGAFEAFNIQTEKITLHSNKNVTATQRLRIVQISDVHIGPMLYPGRLQAIIAVIEKSKPDILVSTGDLIDGKVHNSSKALTALRGIQAPLGKFAVTGNHEYYVGLKQAGNLTKKAGFKMLRNQSIPIGETVVITGVDDPAGGINNRPSEAELLNQVSEKKFSLLLKHRPEVERNSQEKFDLQLSGHTHKGQIFPFGMLVRLFYPLGHGLRTVGPDRHVYISRGTGTWGPPIRLLASPEITIIDVIPMISENKTQKSKAAPPKK